MPLPVLHAAHSYSPVELLRLFHQTETRWSQHLADEEQLEIGTAYANPRLSQVPAANQIRDVALPQGMNPAQAYEQVITHYRARGVRCSTWTINPAAPDSRTRPIIEHLRSLGHQPVSSDVLLLGHTPRVSLPSLPGLKIIPARASFRHTRLLAEEAARHADNPQLADAHMLHLDDPHWDALLALQDQTPVASVGVLSVGEAGRIDHLYVARDHRHQGLGRIMLARALETCARSLFKHVLLRIPPDNLPAHALCRHFGFLPIGQITSYLTPHPQLTP